MTPVWSHLIAFMAGWITLAVLLIERDARRDSYLTDLERGTIRDAHSLARERRRNQ